MCGAEIAEVLKVVKKRHEEDPGLRHIGSCDTGMTVIRDDFETIAREFGSSAMKAAEGEMEFTFPESPEGRADGEYVAIWRPWKEGGRIWVAMRPRK